MPLKLPYKITNKFLRLNLKDNSVFILLHLSPVFSSVDHYFSLELLSHNLQVTTVFDQESSLGPRNGSTES